MVANRVTKVAKGANSKFQVSNIIRLQGLQRLRKVSNILRLQRLRILNSKFQI